MPSEIIKDLLRNVKLPGMVKVRQIFSDQKIASVEDAIREEFEKPEIRDQLKGVKRLALTVGSRGISNLAVVTREIVKNVRSFGIDIFIVPAMGSHAGATAHSQIELLESMGITEDFVGAKIVSSMEVVQLGTTISGLPAYIDANAYKADGIILLNRIKPHTAFRGICESGLVKMAVVGLGKQKGAEAFHAMGLKGMSRNLLELADVVFAKANILFGVAVIENAYDEISRFVFIPGNRIISEEPQLLLEAKNNMPRILFDKFDVLIVEEIGKNISGDGMDPNITGRFYSPYVKGGVPEIQRIVILDLTEESHGNGIGAGMADFASKRFFDKYVPEQVYVNVLTNGVPEPAKLPLIMDTDEIAIKAAVKTCVGIKPERVKTVRIKNTLSLKEIYISEALLPEAEKNKNIHILEKGLKLEFDNNGSLI